MQHTLLPELCCADIITQTVIATLMLLDLPMFWEFCYFLDTEVQSAKSLVFGVNHAYSAIIALVRSDVTLPLQETSLQKHMWAGSFIIAGRMA